MSPANHAVRRSFCPQTTPNLTFQLVLNLGKDHGFRSLQESIDTTTSGGKLIFHMFGALAEFERDVIRERTQAGLQAARARGRKGGRPRVLEGKKLALALSMYEDLNQPTKDICETLGISRSTLYRNVSQKAGQ